MILTLNILLWVLAASLTVPVAVVVIESLLAACTRTAASVPATRVEALSAARPSVAVLIPAHNEELAIAQTVQGVRAQLQPTDRLVVIADNCTDRTAELARQAGAHVLERQNPTQRGKGYALAFGIEYLRSAPPAVVVLLDADTQIQPGTIDALARQASVENRPVQAIYLLRAPANAGPRAYLSSFAFLVKNLVRPLGLSRLGVGCVLTGSGIAMPWDIIAGAPLASGNIVEDMQLGIDLAIAGRSPRLCAPALVTGQLPQDDQVARKQRKRWEHGHLQTLMHQVPRLAWAGVRQARLELVSMALDLAVPPLTLLCMLWAGGTVLAFAAALTGAAWGPIQWLLIVGLSLFVGIMIAWARFARAQVPLRMLLALPFYLLWKIPLYVAYLFKREKEWVRTQRGHLPVASSLPAASLAASSSPVPQINLLGMRLVRLREADCVAHIMGEVSSGRGGWVITPNLDILRRYVQDAEFRALADEADLRVADGMPLVWASRLQRTPLPERVAGSSMIFTLSAAAAQRNRSVFLLGGAPGTAQAAAEELRRRWPSLKVAGTYCPPMGFEDNPAEMENLTAAVISARPDIVFVGLGAPKQERLIKKLRTLLPGAWWLGIGVSFSFVTGDVKRAPRWLQKIGLEWVHRLCQEPRRLARRYLIDGLPFAMRLLGVSAWRGLRGKSQSSATLSD
ncbi:MAG: WecB/TagA/CpsF family glycosyltransferase [Phycisphaeraceae bacterium]|nr:WecB/TagA/CpsF family glycosyltransferase [Phycisphaeraceae bacterium]